MNKRFIFASLILLLFGCNNVNNSTSENSISNTIPENITSLSVNTPTSTSITSNKDSANPSIPQSVSQSISTTSELKISTIKEILNKGKNLKNDEIGELVKFKATYLKAVTMARSNQDMMLFADSNSYIYLRLSYDKYKGYLAGLNKMNDYIIIANVTKVQNVVELALSSTLDAKTSVVKFADTPSCNIEAISESKSSIGDIISDYEEIPLNNKYYGSGKIVSFTAQLVATEYEDSNKKAVFYDGNNVITAIGEKKIVEKYDIGHYYKVTGVLNVEVSSPAILVISCNEVESNKNTVQIQNYETVVPSYFKKWNLTSSKMNTPSISDYLKLYKTTGYIKSDSDRTNAYYIGVVDSENATLSDNGITTSISGFYLMNHLNLSERDLSYSPFYGFVDEPTSVTFYFTLHNFDTNNHAWKAFPLISYYNEPNPNNPNLEITVSEIIQ